MVERGTGAQRQLAVWRANRDLRLLMRKIVEATAVGVTGRLAGSESRPEWTVRIRRLAGIWPASPEITGALQPRLAASVSQ